MSIDSTLVRLGALGSVETQNCNSPFLERSALLISWDSQGLTGEKEAAAVSGLLCGNPRAFIKSQTASSEHVLTARRVACLGAWR